MLKQTCIERSVFKGQYGACIRNIPPGNMFGTCNLEYLFERIGDKCHDPLVLRPVFQFPEDPLERGRNAHCNSHCGRSHRSFHHNKCSHKSNSDFGFPESTPNCKPHASQQYPSGARLADESQIYNDVKTAPCTTPKGPRNAGANTETRDNCRETCDGYINSLLSPSFPDISSVKSAKLENFSSNNADLILRRITTQLQAIQQILKCNNSCNARNTETYCQCPITPPITSLPFCTTNTCSALSPSIQNTEKIMYPSKRMRYLNNNESSCCSSSSCYRIGCCFKSKCCRKKTEKNKFHYPEKNCTSTQRSRQPVLNCDYVNDLIYKCIDANTQFCTMLPQSNKLIGCPCDFTSKCTSYEQINTTTCEKTLKVDQKLQTICSQTDENIQVNCNPQAINQQVSAHIQQPIINADYMNQLICICNEKYMQSYMSRQNNQNQIRCFCDRRICKCSEQKKEAVATNYKENTTNSCRAQLKSCSNKDSNLILSHFTTENPAETANPSKQTDNKKVSTKNNKKETKDCMPNVLCNPCKSEITHNKRYSMPLISKRVQENCCRSSIPKTVQTMSETSDYNENIKDNTTHFLFVNSTPKKVNPRLEKSQVLNVSNTPEAKSISSCMTEIKFEIVTPPTYHSLNTETALLDNLQKSYKAIQANYGDIDEGTQMKSIEIKIPIKSKNTIEAIEKTDYSRLKKSSVTVPTNTFSANMIAEVVPNEGSIYLTDLLQFVDAANSPILFKTVGMHTNTIPMQHIAEKSLQTVQPNNTSVHRNESGYTYQKEFACALASNMGRDDKALIVQDSSLLGTKNNKSSEPLPEDTKIKTTCHEVNDVATNTALISQEDRSITKQGFSLNCVCNTAEIATQANVEPIVIDKIETSVDARTSSLNEACIYCSKLNIESVPLKITDTATSTAPVSQKEQVVDVQKSLLPRDYNNRNIDDITSSIFDKPKLRPVGHDDIQVIYMPKIVTKNMNTNTMLVDQANVGISPQTSLLTKLSCDKCQSKIPVAPNKMPTDIATNTSCKYIHKMVCTDNNSGESKTLKSCIDKRKIPCPILRHNNKVGVINKVTVKHPVSSSPAPPKPNTRRYDTSGWDETFEKQLSANVEAALYFLRQPPLSDETPLPKPSRTCTIKCKEDYNTSDVMGLSQIRPTEKGKDLALKSKQNCPCPSANDVCHNRIVSTHKSDITQCQSFKRGLSAINENRKSPTKCNCPSSSRPGPSGKNYNCSCNKKHKQL